MTALPLLVQVTAQAFGPTAHPGIWRQALALAPHFRQVILQTAEHGYVLRARSQAENESLQRAGITVVETGRAQVIDEAERFASNLREVHGCPSVLLAQLGNSGWRALGIAAAWDAPVFTLFHGNDAGVDMRDSRWRGGFERLRDAPGSRFAGVSGNVVDDLVAWGMPADRCFVQHLGLELSDRAVRPREKARAGPLRVVLAGRLVPFKGHRVGLAAFARLVGAEPESQLHCYGTGSLAEPLAAETHRLGVAGKVHWHGVVPVEELERAWQDADVAIQPSERGVNDEQEGLPNTLLEAMAAGLPVVATRHAGIPEAIRQGREGLLLEEGDAVGMGDALVRLSREPELRERLGAAARDRVESEFDVRDRAHELAERLIETRVLYDALDPQARKRLAQQAASALRHEPATRSWTARIRARLTSIRRRG